MCVGGGGAEIEVCLIPGLPNDLAIQCIARIPIVFHPFLSLVSKTWKSLLQSPLLFNTRHSFNLQEQLLFLMFRTNNSSYQWYALHQYECRRICLPLPAMPSQPVGAACTATHNKIFLIGGAVNEMASTSVLSYSCQSKKWEAAPRMRVPREFSAAGVIDGKIYVMGGCNISSFACATSWAEVFDPKTSAWTPVPSPPETRERWMHGCAVLDGKFLAMADQGGVVYDPVASNWSYVSSRLDAGWRGRAAVVDGILYSYDFLGKIRGYDLVKDRWLELQGVQKGLPKFLSGATLANVAGRLYVVWEAQGIDKNTLLHCAALDIKKESDGGLRATILWSEVILSLPRGTSIVQCLSLAL